jgi:hypothetical protein
MKKKNIIALLLIAVFFLICIYCYYQYSFRNITKKNSPDYPEKQSTEPSSSPSPTPTMIPITPDPTYVEEMKTQTKNEIEMNKALDAYSEKTPLLYLMPVENDEYNIEYVGRSKYKITLKIPDQESAKQKALDWWKEKKIDPSKLDIVWESGSFE